MSSDKNPSHNVYTPRERKNNDTYWHKIGAAWTNDEGRIIVQLNSLPMDGVLHLLTPKAAEESSAE